MDGSRYVLLTVETANSRISKPNSLPQSRINWIFIQYNNNRISDYNNLITFWNGSHRWETLFLSSLLLRCRSYALTSATCATAVSRSPTASKHIKSFTLENGLVLFRRCIKRTTTWLHRLQCARTTRALSAPKCSAIWVLWFVTWLSTTPNRRMLPFNQSRSKS